MVLSDFPVGKRICFALYDPDRHRFRWILHSADAWAPALHGSGIFRRNFHEFHATGGENSYLHTNLRPPVENFYTHQSTTEDAVLDYSAVECSPGDGAVRYSDGRKFGKTCLIKK